MLRQHPDLPADAVADVEREAHGQGIAEASERRRRVLDRLGGLLTVDQRAAVTAVLALDPDAVAALPDDILRVALAGVEDLRLSVAGTPAAQEAARRYLEEIM